MPHNPTTTPLNHPHIGAKGATLTPTDKTPGCTNCSGLTTLTVTCAEATLGRIVAVYPWNIDEDPANHPDTPHYSVEWEAWDLDGAFLPLRNHEPSLMAMEMIHLAQQGDITLGPPPAMKKK